MYPNCHEPLKSYQYDIVGGYTKMNLTHVTYGSPMQNAYECFLQCGLNVSCSQANYRNGRCYPFTEAGYRATKSHVSDAEAIHCNAGRDIVHAADPDVYGNATQTVHLYMQGKGNGHDSERFPWQLPRVVLYDTQATLFVPLGDTTAVPPSLRTDKVELQVLVDRTPFDGWLMIALSDAVGPGLSNPNIAVQTRIAVTQWRRTGQQMPQDALVIYTLRSLTHGEGLDSKTEELELYEYGPDAPNGLAITANQVNCVLNDMCWRFKSGRSTIVAFRKPRAPCPEDSRENLFFCQSGWSSSGALWTAMPGTRGTPSRGTGPDHGPGHTAYAYVEASAPHHPRRTANLTYRPGEYSGLEFWYHMYGDGVGSLAVQVRANHLSPWVEIWRLTGPQQRSGAEAWRPVELRFVAKEVQFAAATARTYAGDVAVARPVLRGLQRPEDADPSVVPKFAVRPSGSALFLVGAGVDPAPGPQASTFASPNITDVAAGHTHYAVLAGGRLYTFGGNDHGQLGLGHQVFQGSPRRVRPPNNRSVTQMALGSAQTAFRAGDQWYAMGWNHFGQLGVRPPAAGPAARAQSYYTTPQPLTARPNITAVALGAYHSLLLSAGRVYVVGWRLGQKPGQGDRGAPVEVVPPNGRPVEAIAAGFEHSGFLAGGRAFVFGMGLHGQLGLGQRTPLQPEPTELRAPNRQPITKLVMGGHHTALLAGPQWYVMGRNEAGELGLGARFRGNQFYPQALSLTGADGLALPITAVSFGTSHALVLTGGRLFAAGGTGDGSPVEVQPPNGQAVSAAAAGGIGSVFLADHTWTPTPTATATGTAVPTATPTATPTAKLPDCPPGAARAGPTRHALRGRADCGGPLPLAWNGSVLFDPYVLVDLRRLNGTALVQVDPDPDPVRCPGPPGAAQHYYGPADAGRHLVPVPCPYFTVQFVFLGNASGRQIAAYAPAAPRPGAAGRRLRDDELGGNVSNASNASGNGSRDASAAPLEITIRIVYLPSAALSGVLMSTTLPLVVAAVGCCWWYAQAQRETDPALPPRFWRRPFRGSLLRSVWRVQHARGALLRGRALGLTRRWGRPKPDDRHKRYESGPVLYSKWTAIAEQKPPATPGAGGSAAEGPAPVPECDDLPWPRWTYTTWYGRRCAALWAKLGLGLGLGLGLTGVGWVLVLGAVRDPHLPWPAVMQCGLALALVGLGLALGAGLWAMRDPETDHCAVCGGRTSRWRCRDVFIEPRESPGGPAGARTQSWRKACGGCVRCDYCKRPLEMMCEAVTDTQFPRVYHDACLEVLAPPPRGMY